MTTLFDETPVLKLKLVASKSEGVRKITDPLRLLTLLLKIVEEEGPRVTVNEMITDQKDELFEALLEGRAPVYWMQWHRILEDGIEWPGSTETDLRSCSLGMLMFMGHIGQFTIRNGGAPVPLALAFEILCFVSASDIGGILTCGFMEDRARVLSTPGCITRLGIRFDITIPGNTHDLDLSEWERNSGIL